jgi:predicted CXXCH cytochrome family protein
MVGQESKAHNTMRMSLQSSAVAAAVVIFVTGTTVSLLSQAPPPVGQAPANLTGTTGPTLQSTYVGSATCRRCHAPIYERWSKTRMANVVTDPKQHPEVVLPDFNKPDPLLTFKLDDVAFVYGTKWKQRYFTKVGDDYFPLSAQWDVTHRMWRPYMVQPNTDWWVPFYPADNMKRPTGPLCDGCHSVNYNVQTKEVAEWNVGCERCHGPGSEHVRRPSPSTIVNPARLDYVRANDTCIQCHSQGQPLKNPFAGQYYDWPVGFHQGANLRDFWKLEEHKLGETTFTHFPDATGHKNRMQGNDFVQSTMYTRGVTCFSCHDVHGTGNNADLIKPVRQLCTTCHGPTSPNGPHAATIEDHTHHARGSAGSECVSCHMPKIEQTIADVNVRSHTFKFITPAMTEQAKIPNACTGCHSDRSNEWATEALKGWSGMSPWRVAPQ